MQVVIDIAEETYKAVCVGSMLPPYVDNVVKGIKNGIPLPKGHGDLIDRGELKTHIVGTEQGTDLEVYLEPTIINAPPIIKADKGE